jgi:hypothetical protein
MVNFSKLSKVAVGAVFIVSSVSFLDAASVFKSGASRVALLELYTSEGCSSCPPAEIWLGGLRDSSNLWEKFVPVSFHVDYWDRLGWPDPLASEKYTARQYLYAQKWDSRAVYTPGFVLNGKEWRQWSSGQEPPSELSEPAGELEVDIVGDNKFRIFFSPIKNDTPKWQASAALLGFEIMSPVKEGENKGKTLEHNFSVVGFSQGTMKKDGNRFSIELTVKNDVMLKPKRLGVAVWVTTDGMTPVQAAGGYLD